MGLRLPPKFEDLRALVRGELERDDRTDLETWLVLSVDEYAPRALDALTVEWDHLQLDRQLPPSARAVSEAFWQAFEAGLADIDPEFDRGGPLIDVMRIPETGDIHPNAETSVFDVRITDSATRRVRVTCPSASLIVASNDLGNLNELWPVDEHECTFKGGRVTFWAFLTAIDAIGSVPFGEIIREAMEIQAVRAIRITDAFFEPL